MDAEQGTPFSWEKQKKQKDSENLQYLEIGGLRGVLLQLSWSIKNAGPMPQDTLELDWNMYRVYKGNVQRLTLMMEGKREDLDTMKRVLTSFEFL